MIELDVIDTENKTVGKYLFKKVDPSNVNKAVIHDVVVNYLANQRQGTHATKTRGFVRGGGKKPWKQKHTGRARHGSIRSPLWRGGGTIFGPQPRDYSYHVPSKMKRIALRESLEGKISDNEFLIIDNLNVTRPKTKDMVSLLERLNLSGKSVLIVTPEKDENVILSARNIPGISVVRAQDLNAYDVVTHDMVLITRDAMGLLEEKRL